jgi:PAS domain S-box-containing protein
MTADTAATSETPEEPAPTALADSAGADAANLLRHARDGVVATDAQGLVTQWNPSAERLLGWRCAEAQGQALSSLLVPAHADVLHDTVAHGGDGLMTMDVLRRDGRVITLELSVFALPTPTGKGTGWFLRDVSERQSIQTALLQSEERYRAVVEHLSEGMIVIQDEKVAYANPRATEIVSMSLAQMQQTGFLTRIHPDDRAMVQDRQRRRLAGEHPPDHYEVRLVLPGEVARWVAVGVSVVPWEGKPAVLIFFADITDQKMLLEAMHHSEQRLRAVVENASEGMVVIQDGVVVFVNQRALQITRRTRRAFFGLNVLEPRHPDDLAMMAERQRRLQTGEPLSASYEMRLMHDDGSVTWIEVGATTVPWDGKTATLGFFCDVSQRKALEVRLRETLAERETILESSQVGIALLSQTRQLRWANRAMRHIFRAKQGPQPKPWGEPVDFEALFVEPEVYRRTHADFMERMRTQRAFEGELQLRRVDGTMFWASVTGKAVNARDATQGTVWTVLDINERKELEVTLQRTASEREAIFSSALVGIAFNVRREIRWVNDKFLEMTGYQREELAGHSSRQLYLDDESFVQEGERVVQQLLREGAYINERQLIRKNGERIWVQMAGRCVFGNDPDAGVIWTFVDITDRKRAEDEVRAALVRQQDLNMLRSRFVTMTSHEFRTPLAAIQSSADLMRHYGDRMSEVERVEVLDGVQAGVQRMSTMLERILLIGKADAQMLEFRPAPLDVHALCRRCVVEARSQYPARADDIELHYQCPHDTGVLDDKLLGHILNNLLSNAMKYSPAGSAVSLRVSQGSAGWVFEVLDAGIGIPTPEQGQLFAAFHRASNVGDISGTGLGLAIVKKAVEVHGGSIEVRSVAGGGSCFTVTLGTASPLPA